MGESLLFTVFGCSDVVELVDVVGETSFVFGEVVLSLGEFFVGVVSGVSTPGILIGSIGK